MKKHLFLVGALIASIHSFSQTIVDFEDLTLPQADTFYTGEDFAGQFVSNGALFENSYETTSWGYSWSGFAYSNMTDNQTPGFDNQYSAFAGSGANSSEKYAIYYNADTLVFPGSGATFGNVSITNTAYAGISMRDGDQFAKQFGSPNGANGLPDGTNGEDYFYVTVYGWNSQDELVDSLEIYLADFRFSDDAQDYILSDWTAFDLSNLNFSKYFTFRFYSSDVGGFGINTPLYFAMDNLEYSEYINTISEEEAVLINVYPNPAKDRVYIKGNMKQFIILSNLGKQVLSGDTNDGQVDVSGLPAGLYFVSDLERKSVQKLIIQ